MKVGVFSAKPYDRQFLQEVDAPDIDWHFIETRLSEQTLPLAKGMDAICAFVNDQLDTTTLSQLKKMGIMHIALRCAGFNNVDTQAAQRLGFSVSRVPAYSPEAVAEHTLALILTLNRKLHKAYNRIKEGNFSLDGLMGFNLHGKTVGIIGTGRIGAATCRIISGFGCKILCHDPSPNDEVKAMGARYVPIDELVSQADIISLHCPLTPETRHMINDARLSQMKPGVMLINTSRGAMVDTQAVIQHLKNGHIGYLGLDVYEMEGDLFFEDLSDQIIQDDVFQRLQTFPNVLITGHQGFFTREAMTHIAQTTADNLLASQQGDYSAPSFLVTPASS
ncbi:D-lactate dehydrogenase [Saliniradius amylolyticus]|uniref:D-lactate dehydrogenase n=1 Tax=Saliniradius amylolyticus TaxID=2183582 RepID=A0A2S2E3L5_9ALTE|nr:2-hydroxyacid dehydrogenase [Saliniradius amylolyticus]AWL11840.1 D-lactate dehydrogenase [Saliniradius amylolyticus]